MTSPSDLTELTLHMHGAVAKYVVGKRLHAAFPTQEQWEEHIATPLYVETMTAVNEILESAVSAHHLDAQGLSDAYYDQLFEAVGPWCESVQVSPEYFISFLIGG